MNINEIIHKINDLKKQLDSLRPLSDDNANRLWQKIRLDWNYNSNSIEGNTLTASETKAFLHHGLTAKGKPFRDYIEMRGHDEALKQLEEILKKETPITETLIKELHKTILVEPYQDSIAEINPGKYKTQKNYLITNDDQRIDFVLPELVPQRMNNLINWTNNQISPPKRKKGKYDLHPLLVATYFHVDFIEIHPFGDGNGRLSRILMNIILMTCGYTPVIVKTDNRLEYYNALNLSTTSNLFPLAEFIGLGLIESLELTLKAAKGEDIDEDADIYKKIEMLKRQLKNKD